MKLSHITYTKKGVHNKSQFDFNTDFKAPPHHH